MDGFSANGVAGILLRVALGIALVCAIMHFVRRAEDKKQQPERTLEAKVAAKRVDTSAAPLWYLVFDLETGERLELMVSEEVYNLLAREDIGRLTFRGREFVRFTRLQSGE